MIKFPERENEEEENLKRKIWFSRNDERQVRVQEAPPTPRLKVKNAENKEDAKSLQRQKPNFLQWNHPNWELTSLATVKSKGQKIISVKSWEKTFVNLKLYIQKKKTQNFKNGTHKTFFRQVQTKSIYDQQPLYWRTFWRKPFRQRKKTPWRWHVPQKKQWANNWVSKSKQILYETAIFQQHSCFIHSFIPRGFFRHFLIFSPAWDVSQGKWASVEEVLSMT